MVTSKGIFKIIEEESYSIYVKPMQDLLSNQSGDSGIILISEIQPQLMFASENPSNWKALWNVQDKSGTGPVIMAVVVDMAGNKRGEMLSLFSSVTIIGNLVGAPLGGFLLGRLAGGGEQQLIHFHIIYGVVAALGMIALLIGIWASNSLTVKSTNGTGKSTVSAVISHFGHSLKNILTDRRIVVTSNMEGVQNLSAGALEAFMPIYIVMVLGYSVFQAGLIWGVQIFVTVLAKPLMGRISDRHGRRPLLFWGMFVCAVPFAWVPWVIDYPILLVLSMAF